MSLLWNQDEVYRRKAYASEAELEAAIRETSTTLFGTNRIYLDVKKRIGTKGKQQNIPIMVIYRLKWPKAALICRRKRTSKSRCPASHSSSIPTVFNLVEEDRWAVKRILFDALNELHNRDAKEKM